MKKTAIIIGTMVLVFLSLTACGKREFGGGPDVSGKSFIITAERADKGDFFMSGSLEVEDGEEIVFTSNLTKGTIGIDLIREPEEQSIDILPDYDGAESFKYEFGGTDSASDSIPAGSYMVKATCLRKATGNVKIEVKPAG